MLPSRCATRRAVAKVVLLIHTYMRGVSRGAVLGFSGAPDLCGALRGENVWTSPRTAPRPSGATQAFFFVILLPRATPRPADFSFQKKIVLG